MGDGTYVVRVGNEAGTVDETYFTIGEQEQPPAGPVVTFMNGTATFATVDTVDGKATLPATNPTLEATTGYVATAYAFTEWVTVDVVNGKEVATSFTADTVVEADTTVYPKFKAQIYKSTGNIDMVYGDVNSDGKVVAMDRTIVHKHIGGTSQKDVNKSISPLLKITVGGNQVEQVAGDVNADNKVVAMDRTIIHKHIGGTSQKDVNKKIYVINK